MKPIRRALVAGIVTVVFGVLGIARAVGVPGGAGRASRSTPAARIVSLAPSLTKTLIAIGARDDIVGVSDYCRGPSIAGLPHVGSWLTPNYEGIARLDPSLIVTVDEPGASAERLRAIAPTRPLAWLGVADMVAGVRALGELTGRGERAGALAARIERTLGHPIVPPAAPSVLMVIGDPELRLSEVWFVRGASVHGAVLEAAGARNAVSEPLRGPPRLSLVEVIALDPDAILVLAPDATAPEIVERVRARWSALGALRAAALHRVGVLAGADVESVGPDVLDLVPRVATELRRLFEVP